MTRLLLTAAIICLPLAAHAQRATATANSNSNSRASAIGGLQVLRNSNSLTANGGRGGSATANNSLTINDPAGGNGNNGNNGGRFPNQAPSVFAPSVASVAQCDSYISLGASGPGAGASFAFPWQNHNCDMRANTATLAGLGMKAAARQRMCFDDDTAAAMAAVGFHCRVGKYAAAAKR